MNVNNDDDGDGSNYNNLDKDSEQKNRRLAVPGREEAHLGRRRGEGARAGTVFWRERQVTVLGRHSGAHSIMEGERWLYNDSF